MADEFDEELDREPEGSIITPIFLGCGAMGLGCLFSLGAILIGVLIFFPGIFALIQEFSETPMIDEALPMLEANPAVVAALGTPIEAEIDDIDEAPGTDGVNVEVGEEIELSATYFLSGPDGTGRLEAVGAREVLASGDWTIRSLVVTLESGEQIRVFPTEQDTPPPPEQLAPPDVPEPAGESAAEDVPAEQTPNEDSAEEVAPAEETGAAD